MTSEKCKKIHYFSRVDNNVALGRSSSCGINEFYSPIESKVWKKVTCKKCLKSNKDKFNGKWKL